MYTIVFRKEWRVARPNERAMEGRTLEMHGDVHSR